MKEAKITTAYIQFTKLVSVIPAILSRQLWRKKVFYRALIYLIFRITSVVGGTIFCLTSLLGFPSTSLVFFLNLIIIIFAWRGYRPNSLKFFILAMFVSILIIELKTFLWKFHSPFSRLYVLNGFYEANSKTFLDRLQWKYVFKQLKLLRATICTLGCRSLDSTIRVYIPLFEHISHLFIRRIQFSCNHTIFHYPKNEEYCNEIAIFWGR